MSTGEQAAYGAWLNSSVHIAMYGYYFLAALGPYMQKYLWWKVYVTRLQIVSTQKYNYLIIIKH